MKIALLLLYVSVFRCPHKIVLFENTSLLWAETIREKEEKAAIKSHKRASQTGNRGSVLVCNVNKGTLEFEEKINDPGNYLSMKYCKLFASVVYGEH